MRSGAGVRIKCLEAAAHGTPLVATSAAIEGSGLSAPSHCWTADTAPEFAKACTEAMSENSEPADRAAAARKVVEMLHNRSNRVEESDGHSGPSALLSSTINTRSEASCPSINASLDCKPK